MGEDKKMEEETQKFNEGYVPVSDGHEIYFAEHGNPEGVPLLLIHGGPGGRSYPSNAQIADLEKYRVIRFDQRGTGKSKYSDQMAGQAIDHQVQDIEALRQALNIDQFVLMGGSYGTTLSCHYRAAYPENVSAHIMRALFFGDKDGADYIAEGGAYGFAMAKFVLTKHENILVPLWNEYVQYPASVDPSLNDLSLVDAYNVLLNSEDQNIVQEAALRFDRMDTSLVTAIPSKDIIDELDETPQDSVNLSRLFFHFAKHAFNDHGKKNITSILNNTPSIQTILIHGKEDYICPVRNAIHIAKSCPSVDVRIVEGAGHSPADEALAIAMKDTLKGLSCG